MENPILFWGAISTLAALFLLALHGLLRREPPHRRGWRSWQGLFNDLRAMLPRAGPLPGTGVTVFLNTAELKALRTLHLDIPKWRTVSNGDSQAITLTLTRNEFETFYRQLYETAQAKIGAAARAQEPFLTGDVLHLGALTTRLAGIRLELQVRES